jgi:hypothetical protein
MELNLRNIAQWYLVSLVLLTRWIVSANVLETYINFTKYFFR